MNCKGVNCQHPRTITERFKKLRFFVVFNLKKEIEELAHFRLFLEQPKWFTGLRKYTFLSLAIHKVSTSF